MEKISEYAIPVLMLVFALIVVVSKRDMNSVFADGAMQGLKTAAKLLPTMIILMACVSMLNASDAVEKLTEAISPALSFVGIPVEIVPLVVVRPISGSAATAMLSDIFTKYGAESTAGRCASVLAGCTDTILYTVSVYFGAVKIKNTRHALPAAFLTQLFALLISCIAVRIFFD